MTDTTTTITETVSLERPAAPKRLRLTSRAKSPKPELSPGTIAAYRAHRTMAAAALDRASPALRKVLNAKIAHYDAMLKGLPPAAPKAAAVVDPAEASPGTIAAWRAHRTMAAAKLKGTSGKTRAALKSKIEHYDSLLAQI